MKKTDPPSCPACPRCQAPLQRTRRHFGDRMIDLFVPVLRYRCQASGCAWQGRLRHARVAHEQGEDPTFLAPARAGFARPGGVLKSLRRPGK